MLSKAAEKRIKKIYKKVCVKSQQPTWEESNQVLNGLIHSKLFRDQDGESFTRLWIFNGTDVEQVKRELNKVTSIEGYWPHTPHDCSGMMFYWGCEISPQVDRTFVTQRGGYDL